MSLTAENRKLPWDWYDGQVPANVAIDTTAFLETSYSFLLYRSKLPEGVRIGYGSTVYLGTMFDLGPRGRISIGKYSLLNGSWFVCDAEIEIGDHALISWNTVFMDNYRMSTDPQRRRRQLEKVPASRLRRPTAGSAARPIRVGRNVWIGFDCCILPGVTIGDGSIVGARSVVASDLPPYSVAAGNPARIIRRIENDEQS